MGEAIGPGDIVECVDARPLSDGSPVPLVLGARYVVAKVWPFLPHNGDRASDWWDCAVDLEGVDPPFGDSGLTWGLYRFRVVGQRLLALKQPAPELESA